MKKSSAVGIETPGIEHRGSLMIAGLCERYRFASTNGIPDQWRRFGQSVERLPGQFDSTGYGVMLPVPGLSDGFDYLTGVEVAEIDDLPDEFRHVQIPGGRYAVFEYRGHVSGIKATWEAVWTRWLRQSGYEVTETPILFEQYGSGFDSEKGEGIVGLWVPVKQ